jgi:hypothetical protein
MFRNNQIAGRQTQSEPEAAPNFITANRQHSETGARLNPLPFDYVIQHLLRLVEYVSFFDFFSDVSRNRIMA